VVEVVGAFLRGKLFQALSDAIPQSAYGSFGSFSQEGLELGEGQLDRRSEPEAPPSEARLSGERRFQVGRMGGRKRSLVPVASMRRLTGSPLWAGRLSIITMSPSTRVGPKTFST